MTRVIVAFDLFRIQHQALEIGAQMAVRHRAELTLLCIERCELRQAAALPFVQEIDRLSATLQPLSGERLDRLWRQRLQEARRWLAEQAPRLALPGRILIESGRYPQTALEWIGDSDLLVLSTPISRSRHRCPPVWVWYDGSAAAERALSLGRELAGERGCPVRVAAPPESVPDLPEPVTVVPADRWPDFLAARECSAVCCPRSHPQASRLPGVAQCPVLLV